MKNPSTLAEALPLVPNYWPLIVDEDKWKKGDELFSSTSGWRPVIDGWLVNTVVTTDIMGRRAIPLEVRTQEARWILFNSMTKRFRKPRMEMEYRGTTHTPSVLGYVIHGNSAFDYPWISHEQRELLGGESAVIEMLTKGPGIIWQWVLGNRL